MSRRNGHITAKPIAPPSVSLFSYDKTGTIITGFKTTPTPKSTIYLDFSKEATKVIKIGDGAFVNFQSNNIDISGINFGNIKEIGNTSFAMTNITRPINLSKITKIGNSAFESCGLTSVTFGNLLTDIGNRAFLGNSDMINMNLPTSIKNIGDQAFSGTPVASPLVLTNAISIGVNAFNGCGLTQVTFGNTLTRIYGGAFSKNQITSLVLPSSLKLLGESAFLGSKLTSLTWALTNDITSDGTTFNKDANYFEGSNEFIFDVNNYTKTNTNLESYILNTFPSSLFSVVNDKITSAGFMFLYTLWLTNPSTTLKYKNENLTLLVRDNENGKQKNSMSINSNGIYVFPIIDSTGDDGEFNIAIVDGGAKKERFVFFASSVNKPYYFAAFFDLTFSKNDTKFTININKKPTMKAASPFKFTKITSASKTPVTISINTTDNITFSGTVKNNADFFEGTA